MSKLFILLWLACSVIVFKHTIMATIKEEMETWGEIDSGLLFLFGLIALLMAAMGPIAILGYLFYNILEGIAQAISESYKKPKENNEWRYKSDPR